MDKHLAKGGANANTLLGDLLRSHISAVGDIWMEEPVNQSSGEFKPLSLKAKACSPLVFRYSKSNQSLIYVLILAVFVKVLMMDLRI